MISHLENIEKKTEENLQEQRTFKTLTKFNSFISEKFKKPTPNKSTMTINQQATYSPLAKDIEENLGFGKDQKKEAESLPEVKIDQSVNITCGELDNKTDSDKTT